MAKFEKRIVARKFRKEGVSIGDIANKLEVSKSSVCLWCQDIELTKDQVQFLKEKVKKLNLCGRMKGAELNRQGRLDRIEIARVCSKKQLGKLSKRDLLIAGLALYWAEGSKSRFSRLAFTNSDPTMIKIILNFFNDIYKVGKERITARVSINEIHRPREEKVLIFWSKFLGLPMRQFRKTSFIKTKVKKVYENHDNYFGTLSVRIEKSNEIWYKILTGIDILKGGLPA